MMYLSAESKIAIERIIGYSFQNPTLLEQAFTTSSAVNEFLMNKIDTLPSSQMLEFIGDSVLSMTVVNQLIEKYGKITSEKGFATSLNEGIASTIKQNLTNKKILSKCIEEVGLHHYLITNNGDKMNNAINTSPSLKEDLFESIIGAVYLDSGMQIPIVSKVVLHLLDCSVFFEPLQQTDFKSQIKNYCESPKRRWTYVYETIEKTGPDHCPTFLVKLSLYQEDFCLNSYFGKGKNTKEAETDAAKQACKEYIGKGN